MFPNRIPSGTPPVAGSTSPSAPGNESSVPPPVLLDARPEALDDVRENRQKLLASKNEAVRILGARMEKIHTDLDEKKITSAAHLEECYAIQEAADILNEAKDDVNVAKDDEKAAVLSRLGLQGKELKIAPDEHLAIHNDLGMQLNKTEGVVATRERREQNVRAAALAATRAANRGRANLLNMGGSRVISGRIVRPHEPPRLRRPQEARTDSSVVSTPGNSRNREGVQAATRAVVSGVSADQAIADNRLTHPEDILAVMATALVIDSVDSRNLRGAFTAIRAVESGVSEDQAIADNRLTHPHDIESVRRTARRLAERGGPRN